jgi:enediyne biosynthesis protein E4
LLRNDTPRDHRWIRLKLVGTRSNRDAIGARVAVVASGRTIHRQRKGGTSLMSSHDPRLLIGVGQSQTVAQLTVRWPSGTVSVLEDLETNRTYEIREPAASLTTIPLSARPHPAPEVETRRGARE